MLELLVGLREYERHRCGRCLKGAVNSGSSNPAKIERIQAVKKGKQEQNGLL